MAAGCFYCLIKLISQQVKIEIEKTLIGEKLPRYKVSETKSVLTKSLSHESVLLILNIGIVSIFST